MNSGPETPDSAPSWESQVVRQAQEEFDAGEITREELDDRVAALEADIEELRAEMREVQGQQKAHATLLGKHGKRLDSLEDKYEQLSKEMAVRYGLGGERSSERKRKVLKEIQILTHDALDENANLKPVEKAYLDTDDIMEAAQVSQQTASRYARELSQKVPWLLWLRPPWAASDAAIRKRLYVKRSAFEDALGWFGDS